MMEHWLHSAVRNLPSPIMGEVTGLDACAAGLVLLGILCQVLHRRLPPGLGTSLFVGATTVGAVGVALHHDWPAPGEVFVVTRVTAMLSAVWALFGWVASRRKHPASPSHPISAREINARDNRAATENRAATVRERSRKSDLPDPDRSLTVAALSSTDNATMPSMTASSPFFSWSLVTGIAVIVLTIYVLIFATCSRLLNPDQMIDRLTPAGLWNIILLLTATLFWAVAVARLQQPVLSLILSALLVWWTSLMIPSAVGTYLSTPGVLLPLQPVWWTWTFQLQFGAAALLLIAAVFQELGYRSRRNRAWPDRLDDLLEPYSRWPAYTHTECVIAAAVLILGVYHIVRPGPPSAALSIANFGAALVAGTTCLYMTYRRWSANSAGLGMALLTLAAVALACSAVLVLTDGNGSGAYATRLPIVFNAVLFAMTIMIALWRWLARFWEQQLLDGLPWTTTGRMIPYALRAAYLSTALAVLVAYQMALWPWRVASSVEDNTLDRFICGLLALAFLTLVTVRGARRAQSSASAVLGIATLIAAAIFVFIRLPTEEYHAASVLRGWLTQYDAVVLSAAALPVLMIAEVLPKTQWRNFAQPLWWLALLVLPAGALMELVGPRRLPADWVRPATLAILGALYLLAGRREHRRAMLALGAVLLLASATTLYRSYRPAQRTVSRAPPGRATLWRSDRRLGAVGFRLPRSCTKLPSDH